MSDPQYSPGQFDGSGTIHPSVSETLPDDVTAGSLLTAAFCFDTSKGTGFTVADSQGNTWESAVDVNDPAGEYAAIWQAKNAKAGPTTVTVTFTGGAVGYCGLAVAEYPGYSDLDGSAGQVIAFDQTFDSGTSGDWESEHDNDVIIGLVVNYVNRAIFGGTDFTLRVNIANNGTGIATEDKIAGAAGTAAATFDASGSTHGMVLGAAFAPLSGTGPVDGTADAELGALTTSAAAHRTVHGAVAASFAALRTAVQTTPPLPTTNLLAHYLADTGLTADADVVTGWADQSGNGNDATPPGNGPLVRTDYDGRVVVRFTGDSQEIDLAGVHEFDATNIAVFMAGRFYGGTLFGLVGYAGNAGHLRDPGTPDRWFAVGDDLSILPRLNSMLLGSDATDSDTIGYTNYETNLVGAHVTFGNATGASIAAFDNGHFGAADILEIAIYEGGAPNIADVRAYFNQKYGLPDSDYSKNVVFEGDSITAGLGLAEPLSFPIQAMRPAIEDWRALSAGTSGATIATLEDRAATVDAMQLGGARNVLSVLIGRNDVGASGATAESVYSNIVGYVQERVAVGWEVWVGTCIATGEALQEIIDPLNDLIRAGIITDAGASRVIDYGAQPHFQTSADAADTTYYQGDSTHPTVAGAALLADFIAGQLESTVVDGAVTIELGPLATAATGRRTVHGRVSAGIGDLAGTSTGRRTVSGTVDGHLGPMDVETSGVRTAHGGVDISLAGVATTIHGETRSLVHGAAVVDLGDLRADVTGRRTVHGSVLANLGQLRTRATSAPPPEHLDFVVELAPRQYTTSLAPRSYTAELEERQP
jgi:lysophospholipase L1-like esterase